MQFANNIFEQSAACEQIFSCSLDLYKCTPYFFFFSFRLQWFDYDVLEKQALNHGFYNGVGAADFAAQNCTNDKNCFASKFLLRLVRRNEYRSLVSYEMPNFLKPG